VFIYYGSKSGPSFCVYGCRRLNRDKTGHELAETLVTTIDQISRDIVVSYGHEIGYDMHQCVSLSILNHVN
jgi:hypothetical protein